MRAFVQGRLVRGVPEVVEEVRRGSERRITEYGEEILHRPCRAVTEFGAARWAGLIDDMFTTLWIANGCGLAANQVDVDAQLFVYDLTDEDGVRHLGHVFNPTVETASAFFGTRLEGEGCLSVPGAYEPLDRPARVTLEGFDLEGRPLRLEAVDYFARCLIHETQHLQGQVFVDHLTSAQRDRALATSARERAATLDRRAARAAELRSA